MKLTYPANDKHVIQRFNAHVLHIHVYIVPTMLTELHVLYPLQDGDTPLHFAAWRGHTTCLEHLLSTPGIDVNIRDRNVSLSIES